MILNPASSGWIKKHFAMLQDDVFALSIKNPRGFDNEEIIFGTLVSTGLVYGIPLGFIGIDPELSIKWTKEEKLKVLLHEALFAVYQTNFGRAHVDLEEYTSLVFDFYKSLGIKKVRSLLKMITGQSQIERVESILQKRASIDKKLNNKLWINYQTNSLVFTDVILFHQYLVSHLSGEELQERRSMIVSTILKVVASSIHCDGEPGTMEINTYRTYLASAGFQDDENDEFSLFEKDKIELETISGLNHIKSWLVKRYILETAILIMWSDQLIDDEELRYLQKLTDKLGMKTHDLDNCMMFIETFVLENFEEIPFFSDDKAYARIYGDLSSRFVKLLSRNKDKLAKELSESKDLVQLITKSTHAELDAEEKKRMRDQMMDIIKTIPALAIFLLPGGAVLLPIVLKVIPKLIPSAFRQNQIEVKDKKDKS